MKISYNAKQTREREDFSEQEWQEWAIYLAKYYRVRLCYSVGSQLERLLAGQSEPQSRRESVGSLVSLEMFWQLFTLLNLVSLVCLLDHKMIQLFDFYPLVVPDPPCIRLSDLLVVGISSVRRMIFTQTFLFSSFLLKSIFLAFQLFNGKHPFAIANLN